MRAIHVQGHELETLVIAPRSGQPMLVLGHGAGAPMDHAHMNALSEALARFGIGTFRFNFPFMQAGRRRVDSKEVCLDVLEAALEAAGREAHSLFVGGHSFGGRMATHLLDERDPDVTGGVLFSFPLHPDRKPDTKRADHLPRIRKPMLFVSGDRDTLADRELLESVAAKLAGTTLHFLHTADHGYRILKRTRTATEDVYDEAARVTASWLSSFQ